MVVSKVGCPTNCVIVLLILALLELAVEMRNRLFMNLFVYAHRDDQLQRVELGQDLLTELYVFT